MQNREQAIRDIFDREVSAAEADYEPSVFMTWLTNLRDEVLATRVVVTDDMVERAVDGYMAAGGDFVKPMPMRAALEAALNPERNNNES